MSKIPVSVIIMTKNEEKNISKCLKSVSDFDQVFVVDSNSEDRTGELVLTMGATLVNFTWDGKYPKKKQWSLDNLPFKHQWVLYVDADEEVYPELASEIKELFANGAPKAAGYFVGFDYVFLGKVLKHGQRVYKLVLLDRTRSHFIDYDDLDAANMWEVEGHYQPSIKGDTAVLKGCMLHDDHDCLFNYFARHNRYSDWEAHLRLKDRLVDEREAQPGARMLMKKVFNILPFKGAVSFIYAYIFRLGFLDGKAGFHYALAKSFYYWQIGIKQSELSRKG